MLMEVSVEASVNTAIKIHLVNLRTSISRRILGKKIDAHQLKSQRDNFVNHARKMSLYDYYCVSMVSHMNIITEDIR